MASCNRANEFKKFVEFSKSHLMAAGEAIPMFHAFAEDGGMYVYATPWTGEQDKAITLTKLAHDFYLKRVTDYFFMAETWVKSMTDEEAKEREKSPNPKMPMDYPDRVEALMVLWVHRDGSEIHTFEMIRNKNGKLTGFTERERDITQFSGRLTKLLPEKGKVRLFL